MHPVQPYPAQNAPYRGPTGLSLHNVPELAASLCEAFGRKGCRPPFSKTLTLVSFLLCIRAFPRDRCILSSVSRSSLPFLSEPFARGTVFVVRAVISLKLSFSSTSAHARVFRLPLSPSLALFHLRPSVVPWSIVTCRLLVSKYGIERGDIFSRAGPSFSHRFLCPRTTALSTCQRWKVCMHSFDGEATSGIEFYGLVTRWLLASSGRPSCLGGESRLVRPCSLQSRDISLLFRFVAQTPETEANLQRYVQFFPNTCRVTISPNL